MENKELSALKDQELLKEAKKIKSFSLTNAFLIGFFFGIVGFSIFNNSFGFLMLIPLYIIYRMINDPKNNRVKEVKELKKQRNL